MPASKQTPLTAPRGSSVLDLSQPRVNWEAAAFDEAEYFAVVRMARRGDEPLRREFTVLPWAVRFARVRDDVCLYAVAPCGRFALLDREKWDEWEVRWKEARDERVRRNGEIGRQCD